jgi:hypothetical protein
MIGKSFSHCTKYQFYLILSIYIWIKFMFLIILIFWIIWRHICSPKQSVFDLDLNNNFLKLFQNILVFLWENDFKFFQTYHKFDFSLENIQIFNKIFAFHLRISKWLKIDNSLFIKLILISERLKFSFMNNQKMNIMSSMSSSAKLIVLKEKLLSLKLLIKISDRFNALKIKLFCIISLFFNRKLIRPVRFWEFLKIILNF